MQLLGDQTQISNNKKCISHPQQYYLGQQVSVSTNIRNHQQQIFLTLLENFMYNKHTELHKILSEMPNSVVACK